jgi:hypothetical protein
LPAARRLNAKLALDKIALDFAVPAALFLGGENDRPVGIDHWNS